jgi:ABC-type phosphate/phosphonate transport system permease subunit
MDDNTSILHEAVKAAPSIVVSGLVVMGQHLSDIAIVLTILYTSIMIFITLRDKIYKPYKRSKTK